MIRLLLSVTIAATLSSGLVAEASSNANHKNHVIVVTIDGCGAFYLSDPKASIPNLRKLAGRGVAAKGMIVANPAVTWPNHTTIVTGVLPSKHSLLYNGLLVRDKKGGWLREEERSKMEMIAVPTVYDFLHEKGYTTAGINWSASQGASTLDFCMPDLHTPIPYSTPQLIKELTAAGILDDSSPAAFLKTTQPKRDQIWTDAACYLLREHRPNLLLLHFLITDSTQHRFGPQGPEAYNALKIVDGHIGELCDTLDKTGLSGSTSLFIVADHGFERVYKQIVSGTILRKAGLLETDDGMTRVQAIPEGGTLMVYFCSAKTREADRAQVVKLFKHQEGVDKIIEPKNFAKYGYPSPEKNPRMADLVISAKRGYSFAGVEKTDETVISTRPGGNGSHGYLASDPNMNAIFIAAGRGIAKGKKIGFVKNIDIAPTVSYLLGEKFPNADGKVLKQIL
ncbi:MAG TPA: ectonucleotide pyrophosphatase/phosphodiesterase, partial [Verrucomicrobiae bacterium]|nr:ectonucleotide pyrophosphatase/phosphodiesterase [Verrucomicrobiae bacterium]